MSFDDQKLPIAISACLLGHPVRYDGGHKYDRMLVETLSRYVQWMPLCPEVERGMGTPRERIKLVFSGGRLRLVGVDSRHDHTAAMRRYALRRVRQLERSGVCGCILKSGSPSCAVRDAAVHRPRSTAAGSGPGFFARTVTENMPDLPVDDEISLADPARLENWMERVVALARLTRLWSGRWGVADVKAVHDRYGLALAARPPAARRRVDRLLETARAAPRRQLRRTYQRELMAALAVPPTRAGHRRALRKGLRELRSQLDETSRRKLEEQLDAYTAGRVPLAVPVTLLAHYADLLEAAPLRNQTYLHPHPVQLACLARP